MKNVITTLIYILQYIFKLLDNLLHDHNYDIIKCSVFGISEMAVILDFTFPRVYSTTMILGILCTSIQEMSENHPWKINILHFFPRFLVF